MDDLCIVCERNEEYIQDFDRKEKPFEDLDVYGRKILIKGS